DLTKEITQTGHKTGRCLTSADTSATNCIKIRCANCRAEGNVTNQSQPLITVAIAAYNAAPYLERAVNSVRRQTLRNIEVIVCDDFSTDGSRIIAERLSRVDDRIRVLQTTDTSSGVGAPRNVALRNARGKYITFLDGRDTL